jgi:hypothetical protein
VFVTRQGSHDRVRARYQVCHDLDVVWLDEGLVALHAHEQQD